MKKQMPKVKPAAKQVAPKGKASPKVTAKKQTKASKK